MRSRWLCFLRDVVLFFTLFTVDLHKFRWYRKTYGGRWELWWVDCPVCSCIWHNDCEEGVIPPLCHGGPDKVEDYT